MGCVQNKQNIIIKTTQSHSSKKKTLNFFKEQNEKSQNNTIMNKSSDKAQLILMSVSESDGQSCQSIIDRQVEEMTNQIYSHSLEDNNITVSRCSNVDSNQNSPRTSNRFFL